MKNNILCSGALGIALFALGTAEAQAEAQNNIFIEGGGAAVAFPLPSVNYERVIKPGMSVRAGLAMQPDSYNGVTLIGVPLTVNYTGLRSGSGIHQLELGLGGLLLANKRSDTYDGYGDWFGFDGTFCDECEAGTTDVAFGIHGVIGYRLQLPKFQLRAGLSPALLFGKPLPIPHLSLGYSF